MTGEFFEAMGMRLLRGRSFDSRDTAIGGRVAVLSDAAARLFWIKAALEKRGQRIEDLDAAIAAHAAATGATLVTANARQMARVPGVRIENWLA